MTEARILKFPPQLGRCLECGWKHPDPRIKFLRWCPVCEREPLYPWECPNCGTEHLVTFGTILSWSVTTRQHPNPTGGIRISMRHGCPECARDAGNLKVPQVTTPEELDP